MHISHGARHQTSLASGYGYAADRMVWALRELGHKVVTNDSTAPVQIWFDQPQHWTWNPGQYRIGYHPWESTQLKPGWVELMNQCDEIWTPSPLIADWYRADGVTVPVYTYEHGVDKMWSPQNRPVEDKIKFLHIGGEAFRKGLSETLRGFRAAFPDRDDVSLTVKMINPGWNVPLPGRVKLHNERLSLGSLVQLYHDHHVFVYPSWGEGFGLTPLQALATGMPTIITQGWAPYEEEADAALVLRSKLVDSPWPRVHPGKMFQPDFDELVDTMRWVVEDYEDFHNFAQRRVPLIQLKYDWVEITETVFKDLEQRLNSF